MVDRIVRAKKLAVYKCAAVGGMIGGIIFAVCLIFGGLVMVVIAGVGSRLHA